MTDRADLPCDETLVNLLYYVLLGRDPESKILWLGAPISEAARATIASDEFRSIASDILDLKFSQISVSRSRAARSLIAKKLVLHGAPEPRSHLWHDLHLSALLWLGPIAADDETRQVIGPLIEAIQSEFNGSRETDDVLDEILQFDREWFLAYNRNLMGLDRLSDVDLHNHVAQLTFDGDAELSPYFSISGTINRELRQEMFHGITDTKPLSLEFVSRRLRAAAKRGTIWHWLFDERYYVSEREKFFAKRGSRHWEPLDQAYLDFIANGDRNRVRPHPLFCPVAYKILNSDVDGKLRPFAHYLRVGQFSEFRTSVLFDPNFFKVLNPMVPLDVASGRFASALESFCKGGLECGYTFSPDFDVSYYCATYDDVQKVCETGMASAVWHFLTEGAVQGRRSNPYFDPKYYLERYPAAKDVCEELSIAPIEHFLLFGNTGGLRPSKPLIDREIDISQAKAIYERRAIDSLIRLSRTPLDFSDFGGPDPILSVVVPVHNQVSFTARFLELAYYACAEMKRRTGASTEIMVVSNGSTDQTNELLRTIVGIKSLVTADTIGYPRAVNKGAEVATGRFLLIVNNDIEFDPGIFADLIASIAETPNCSVMGPRILSMDMTIQEIGSFVARDGSTGGYQRGARSSRQSARLKTKVDYVSGCFLCVERADFKTLGGFDEAFSPGYYDEVDLCLRIVESLGKDVLVNSDLSISHYENASFMKGRPIAVSYPLILRNRQKLLRKHPKISNQMARVTQPSASDTSLHVGRETRMLVIADMVPTSRFGTEDSRTVDILRAFHDLGVSYDILALNPTGKFDEYEYPDVAVHRAWMSSQSAEELLTSEVPEYSHIWVSGTHNLSHLTTLLKLYKDRHGATIICDADAVHAQRIIEMGRAKGQGYSENEVEELVTSEFSGAHIVDHFVVVSERDAAIIRRAGIAKVFIVTLGVVQPPVSVARWEERSRILMVASVQSAMSAAFDNISWFARGVMPKIEHLGKSLTIAGAWDQHLSAQFIKSHPSADVEFLGEVTGTALADLYAESIVALAPTRFAAGIPCLVIEAMLSGTPIVMSDLLGDQIGIAEQDMGLLAVAPFADEGKSFADTITRLVSDREYWTVVRDGQLAFATTNFSQENFIRQLVSVLKETELIL